MSIYFLLIPVFSIHYYFSPEIWIFEPLVPVASVDSFRVIFQCHFEIPTFIGIFFPLIFVEHFSVDKDDYEYQYGHDPMFTRKRRRGQDHISTEQ